MWLIILQRFVYDICLSNQFLVCGIIKIHLCLMTDMVISLKPMVIHVLTYRCSEYFLGFLEFQQQI